MSRGCRSWCTGVRGSQWTTCKAFCSKRGRRTHLNQESCICNIESNSLVTGLNSSPREWYQFLASIDLGWIWTRISAVSQSRHPSCKNLVAKILVVPVLCPVLVPCKPSWINLIWDLSFLLLSLSLLSLALSLLFVFWRSVWYSAAPLHTPFRAVIQTGDFGEIEQADNIINVSFPPEPWSPLNWNTLCPDISVCFLLPAQRLSNEETVWKETDKQYRAIVTD